MFQITLSLWYLFSLLGVSVFAGVFVMVTTVPLTGKLSMMSRQLQKKVMVIKVWFEEDNSLDRFLIVLSQKTTLITHFIFF